MHCWKAIAPVSWSAWDWGRSDDFAAMMEMELENTGTANRLAADHLGGASGMRSMGGNLFQLSHNPWLAHLQN